MKASSSPLFHNRKDKIFSVIAVVAIVGGLMIAFSPARAYSPLVANVSTGAWAAGFSYTVSLTVNAVGDQVAVFASIRVPGPVPTVATTGITSPGVLGGFTQVVVQQTVCVSNNHDGICSGSNGTDWFGYEALWTGIATTTGSITLTVAVNNNAVTAAATSAIAYDLQYVGMPSTTTSGCSEAYKGSCLNPINGGISLSSPSGIELQIVGALGWSALPSAVPAACGISNYASGSQGHASAWQQFQQTVVPGCGLNFSGFTGYETGYAFISAVWASNSFTTTSTTTINTMCANCGSNNGTGTYGATNELYFYYSQNVQTYGTIDNETVFVKSVHINANTGTLNFLFYSTFNMNPPSAGNPWILVSGYTNPFTVTNSTSNFYIHLNPQFAVCSLCWFAVAIMPVTTASRGSGASGSGIALAEVAQPSSPEYQYAVGSSTPPATFFSNTQKTHSDWDWVYYHLIYPVTVVTSTVTSTTTQGATATSTVLVTFTATTLDLTTAPGAFTNYAELLIVILTPAMIIAVPIAAYTRSPQGAGIGFVAGLMIGSGIGVQAALVPPVFLGVMVIVGVFMIVGLSRSGGGAM